MERILGRFGVNRKVFIHNAGPPIPSGIGHLNRDIDFLWVNRLIDQRRSDWFVDVLAKKKFKKSCNRLIGIERSQGRSSAQNQGDYVHSEAGSNIVLEEFTAPEPYYEQARFFVLPATIVFCNHALLEAMAYGVVPIVSDSNGTELIIQDGVNGFVCEHSRQGLESAMLHAFELDDDSWEVLSQQARETVQKKFSREVWGEKVSSLYGQLNCPC
jgi:glycosyltransferase involved in cell wall biosynthesis